LDLETLHWIRSLKDRVRGWSRPRVGPTENLTFDPAARLFARWWWFSEPIEPNVIDAQLE
jgi:hypothetical protein